MSTTMIGSRPYTNIVGNKRIYFDDLNLTDVSLRDVARGLAHENRYSGQTFRPYSVLEHSLHCEEHYVIGEQGIVPGVRLALLMHDAHEFLCKDMPSPLKALLPGYRDFERRCELATWRRFGIVEVMKAAHGIVHRVDLLALNTERKFFGFEDEGDWPSFQDYPASAVIGSQLSWLTCELQRSSIVTLGRMQDQWVERVVEAMDQYNSVKGDEE